MKVLVPAAIHDELTARLTDLPGVTLVPYTEDGEPPTDATEAAVFRGVAGKRYESLVLNGPEVRWLHTASAGVDHVLTPALKARPNLTLTDSGPAFGICISEYVLTWMLALAHRVPTLLDCQTRKDWHQRLRHEELFGQTVGIIGLGPIGQGVAARCKAFGMRVLGFRRTDRAAENVDAIYTGKAGLHFLLAASDWVVVAAALTGETQSLLGEEEIARMKPTARLINVARGALIDEAALLSALNHGVLSGAVLDVFMAEPLPPDSPLWTTPNLFVTPHNAPGWSDGLRRRQQELFIDNLRRFVAGQPLTGVVDMLRGY